MKERKTRTDYLEYLSIVHRAQLDMKCKALLWHYAWAYNWKERKPSYYTQKQICALTSMSPSTYQNARRKLAELGWIAQEQRARDLPVFVAPRRGKDDPDYKKWSWSKGHPDEQESIEEIIASLPEDFRDPFDDGE